MEILMVLTSHGELGATGYHTGFWLEEFTTPFYAIRDAGVEITVASPVGGQPPIDPRSGSRAIPTASLERFKGDREARALLGDTLRLDQIDITDFAGAYFPGGYGAMWDLAVDDTCQSLIRDFDTARKPIAFVCHAQAALVNVREPSGRTLVAGRHLTCLSNTEELASGLSGSIPFLLQDELISLGALYSKAADGVSHVVVDGTLITGQNLASTTDTARALLHAVLAAQQL
jgi:putative intracellular protease/amidase